MINIFKKIKKNLITGILIVLPLAITAYILKIIISFIQLFVDTIKDYFYFLNIFQIPNSEIITLIIFVILIGYTTKKLQLESSIFEIEKKIIERIPIINFIYNSIKKITNLIKQNQNEKHDSQLIAWVKLPQLNIYCIGFLIGELETRYAPETNKKYFSFFIPTTPNPVTGYYIIAREDEFIFNNMSKEEAISIIISGGIIRPEK